MRSTQYTVATLRVNKNKLLESKGMAKPDWKDTYMGVRRSLMPIAKNEGDDFEVEAPMSEIKIDNEDLISGLQVVEGDTSVELNNYGSNSLESP